MTIFRGINKNQEIKSGEYIITRGVGGNYWVNTLFNPNEEIQCNAPGIFKNQGIKPIAGDLVYCEETGDELIPLVMQEIFERRNELPRPQVANIDLLWLIIPLSQPEPDLNVLDKMLVISEVQNMNVEIIFTKYDLASNYGDELSCIYKNLGYNVFLSEPNSESLFNELRSKIDQKLICLAGPSGAGKSTLLNILAQNDLMETGDISKKLGRGRHTTRHAELFPFRGGYVTDTPGFSSLELTQLNIDGQDLAFAFPEIRDLQYDCKFNSCKHLEEPGCAVKESESINSGRLERYQNFRKNIDSYNSYDRRKN